MAFRPEVTVAAVVMRDDRFLMVEERIHGKLVLNQPAGHLEDRETLLDAAIREAREETAWRFRATTRPFTSYGPKDGVGSSLSTTASPA